MLQDAFVYQRVLAGDDVGLQRTIDLVDRTLLG